MSKNQIIETKIGTKIWIDITNPTRKKLKKIQEIYKIHDADITASLDSIVIPKTFEHKNYLFIAIHAGHLDNSSNPIFQEIDIFFSKRFIITIHNKPIYFLQDIYNEIESSKSQHNTAYILYQIIKAITSDNNEIVKQYATEINKLEINLFNEKASDKSVVSQILTIRKNLLSLSNVSRPNINVLKEIHKSNILKNYLANYIVYFDSLVESLEKNQSMTKHYIEIVNGFIDTVNIMVNYRFNDIIKILTVVSVTLLPLTLIAGILGMNFKSMIFNVPFGFTITILLMIILEIIIIQFFKYKKWL